MILIHYFSKQCILPLIVLPLLPARTKCSKNDGNITNDAGDLITYTITVENTGNVDLSNIQVTDNLKDAGNNNLSLTTSLTRNYPVVEINVTVGAASIGGNAYYFDGVEKAQITLERGRVYKFIQSSGTNVSHPIAFRNNC